MSNSKPLFIKDMAKGDYITVLILSIITIILAIINIAMTSGDYNEMKSVMDPINEVIAMYGEEALEYMPSEYMEVINWMNFFNVFIPIFIAVKVWGLINAVLVIIKFRPAYLTMIFYYIVSIIISVVDAVACIIMGVDPGVPGTIVSITVTIALIKMFAKIFISSGYSNTVSSASTYNPSVDNLRPEATSTRYSSVPTPVGSEMQSVGGPTEMPSIGAAPVEPAMSSVNLAKPAESNATGGVQLAKPVSAAKWQCRGCGMENDAASGFCMSCGSQKE